MEPFENNIYASQRSQNIKIGTKLVECATCNTKMSSRRLTIVPRVKDVNGVVHQPEPVELTAERLEAHFSLPLNLAAKHLGVCETSLKR